MNETFSCMRDQIQAIDASLIQSINQEWIIVKTLGAMKTRDHRMKSECFEQMQKIIDALEAKNKTTTLSTYGIHRMSKLYLIVGAIKRKPEYVERPVRMLKSKYDIIPDIFICESMHLSSTWMLIAGYLRTAKISVYVVNTVVKSLVLKYFEAEYPYKEQLCWIYRDAVWAGGNELPIDSCNLAILSTKGYKSYWKDNFNFPILSR